MKTLIVALGCMLAVAAQARIGETPEQCAERYGPGTLQADGGMLYRKAGLMIRAQFHQGKCESITYGKEDHARTQGLSETEVAELMDANAHGQKWQRHPKFINVQITEDSLIRAMKQGAGAILVIKTEAQDAREKAARAAKERKNLEGF